MAKFEQNIFGDLYNVLQETESPAEQPKTSGLQPGTRIKLSFAASEGKWRRATQAAIIEWRLSKHKDEFYIWSIDYQQESRLDFTIEIRKPDPEHLWTERRIVNLILDANPLGFYLIFKSAVVEKAGKVWEKTKEPVLIATWLLALAVVGFLIYAMKK